MVLKSFLNLSLVVNLQHTDKTKFLAIEKVDCLISSGMSLRGRGWGISPATLIEK